MDLAPLLLTTAVPQRYLPVLVRKRICAIRWWHELCYEYSEQAIRILVVVILYEPGESITTLYCHHQMRKLGEIKHWFGRCIRWRKWIHKPTVLRDIWNKSLVLSTDTLRTNTQSPKPAATPRAPTSTSTDTHLGFRHQSMHVGSPLHARRAVFHVDTLVPLSSLLWKMGVTLW